MKRQVQTLYKRYSYALTTPEEVRFKNLYAMVLRYEPEGGVDELMMTAGFLDFNLMYEKKAAADGKTGGKDTDGVNGNDDSGEGKER